MLLSNYIVAPSRRRLRITHLHSDCIVTVCGRGRGGNANIAYISTANGTGRAGSPRGIGAVDDNCMPYKERDATDGAPCSVS